IVGIAWPHPISGTLSPYRANLRSRKTKPRRPVLGGTALMHRQRTATRRRRGRVLPSLTKLSEAAFEFLGSRRSGRRADEETHRLPQKCAVCIGRMPGCQGPETMKVPEFPANCA